VVIRAVVFDIGGVLELAPEQSGEPSATMERLIAEWDERLQLEHGALAQQLTAAAQGAASEAKMQERLLVSSGCSQAQIAAFMDAFWDVYMGEPNTELLDYVRGLRPAYQTAILSNSFVGAREREEARYLFASLVDLLIYSHEEGIAKPDSEIFQRTWQRLGVAPAEMVFVDDVAGNVSAAHALGIVAVPFETTRQTVADLERCLA
jgi:epoxide hydrolase-like predicted phosphatase